MSPGLWLLDLALRDCVVDTVKTQVILPRKDPEGKTVCFFLSWKLSQEI